MQKLDRNALAHSQLAGGTAKSGVTSTSTNDTNVSINITLPGTVNG